MSIPETLPTIPNVSSFVEQAEAYRSEHTIQKTGWLQAVITWLRYHVILTFSAFSSAKKADCVFKNVISESPFPQHLTHIGGDTATKLQGRIIEAEISTEEVVQLAENLKIAYCMARSEVSQKRIIAIAETVMSKSQKATVEKTVEEPAPEKETPSSAPIDDLVRLLIHTPPSGETTGPVIINPNEKVAGAPQALSEDILTLTDKKSAAESKLKGLEEKLVAVEVEIKEYNAQTLPARTAAVTEVKTRIGTLTTSKTEIETALKAVRSDKEKAAEQRGLLVENKSALTAAQGELKEAEAAETEANKKVVELPKQKAKLTGKISKVNQNISELTRQIDQGKKDSRAKQVVNTTKRSVGHVMDALTRNRTPKGSDATAAAASVAKASSSQSGTPNQTPPTTEEVSPGVNLGDGINWYDTSQV